MRQGVMRLTRILFAVYVSFLLYLTVIKRFIFGITTGMFLENYRINVGNYLEYSVNLIPFRTIYGYLVYPPSMAVASTNILGNMLAFMPLGVLVPLVFRRLNSARRIFVVSVGTSVLIECIQLLLRVGSMDVDDVLLNCVGGLLGFVIYRGFMKFFMKKKSVKLTR